MCRGLTCIQVEPYESEGQSYELCRSERNPADNKKKNNRLLKQSYTAAEVLHGLHALLGSKSKQTKLIYKLTSQCSYFHLINVTHHECRASNTTLENFLAIPSVVKKFFNTEVGLKSLTMFLTMSLRCCEIIRLTMISWHLLLCVAGSPAKA